MVGFAQWAVAGKMMAVNVVTKNWILLKGRIDSKVEGCFIKQSPSITMQLILLRKCLPL